MYRGGNYRALYNYTFVLIFPIHTTRRTVRLSLLIVRKGSLFNFQRVKLVGGKSNCIWQANQLSGAWDAGVSPCINELPNLRPSLHLSLKAVSINNARLSFSFVNLTNPIFPLMLSTSCRLVCE